MEIRLPENIIEASFVERINRFAARVEVAGYALGCRVGLDAVKLNGALPVLL